MLIIVFIGLVQCGMYVAYPQYSRFVVRTLQASLQVVGGAIILYTIDSNMGMFKKQGLLAAIKEWWISCPLATKCGKVSVQLETTVLAAPSHIDSVSINQKHGTVEERLDDLQRQIHACHTLIHEQKKAQNEYIQGVKKNLEDAFAKQRAEVVRLSDAVTESTVGNFKLQSLGALLIGYGAILSAFS